MYGALARGAWAETNVACKGDGQVGPVFVNSAASVAIGPLSDWVVEKLKQRQQMILDLDRDNSTFDAMAFGVNEKRFGKLVEIVSSWHRSYEVGSGIDLSDGTLHQVVVAERDIPGPINQCATKKDYYLELSSIPYFVTSIFTTALSIRPSPPVD